jgi:hypothetical protein
VERGAGDKAGGARVGSCGATQRRRVDAARGCRAPAGDATQLRGDSMTRCRRVLFEFSKGAFRLAGQK